MADEDPRLRLIWEEGVRAVEQQAQVLNEVRSRAATILSAASIAGAFLASSALSGGEEFRASTWVAVVAFAVVGLATSLVLMPHRGWRLERRPQKMLEDFVEGERPVGIDDLLHELAGHLDNNFVSNRRKLRWLTGGLTVGCVALVVEILAFLWDLQSRR